MTDFEDVLAAWQQPDSAARIHPTRQISEEAYWFSGEPQAQEVFDLVGEGARVIDFGAGDGRVAIPMFRAGLKVLAVDASREALQRLIEKEPGIATLVSDGNDMQDYFAPKGEFAPFPPYDRANQGADALVCRAVLIHHSYKDVARLVQRFAEVVKPGGLLIADWPLSETPAERSDWIGVTTWDRSIRDEVAKRAGWVPVKVASDPSVWMRVDDADAEIIEAIKTSGGVRTEDIDNALPPNKVIREWAAANGHTVSAKGKIPSEVLVAYLEAQGAEGSDVL